MRTINFEMHQCSILIYCNFSTLIVFLIMFCVQLLPELMILFLTHHVTNQLTCCNKLRYSATCNLIWKIRKCNARNIRKCNSTSNYIFIFGKLFYVFKQIHIDLKPRILIASFLLAPLLNS